MASPQDKARAALDLALDAKVLALLPGSRGSELTKLVPPFLQTAQQLKVKHPELVIITAMVNEQKAQLFNDIKEQVAPNLAVTMVTGQTQTVMAASDCLLMASGTATLEAALIKRPMVINYKFNWLTYQIGKAMVKLKWFSLPNLLANKELAPELLQDDVCQEKLVPLVEQRLYTDQSNLEQEFITIHQKLKQNASVKAAQAVKQLISL
jgi:lipid-A-disaccharide synthase